VSREEKCEGKKLNVSHDMKASNIRLTMFSCSHDYSSFSAVDFSAALNSFYGFYTFFIVKKFKIFKTVKNLKNLVCKIQSNFGHEKIRERSTKEENCTKQWKIRRKTFPFHFLLYLI
jgi:hypothetical protein